MSALTHSAAETAKATEELPNIITILEHLFPRSPLVHFFYEWENIIFSILALGLVSYTALRAARKQSFIPKGIQNIWEFFVEFLTSFVTGILGPKGIEHVPLLGTLFIYILFENWFGLIPFMKSPTSAWSTTIALALVVTIYVQWVGIKEHGTWNYLKHLAGNPQGFMGIVMVPLMLFINLCIEYLAVPLSLSLRLFANVSSEDKLLYKFAELNVMYYLLPFGFQLFINLLALVFSFLQAFVFLLLPTIYIALILPHEENEEPHAKTLNASH